MPKVFQLFETVSYQSITTYIFAHSKKKEAHILQNQSKSILISFDLRLQRTALFDASYYLSPGSSLSSHFFR